jgi:parallel beta-helix repeat protein
LGEERVLKRMFSILMLTLLLTSMLTLAFKIQPVKAEGGTIYIRADGSIDPPTAPIFTTDNVTYTFTGNISGSIAVQRGNIVVDGHGFTIQGSVYDSQGLSVSTINGVTIKNININGFQRGIIGYSSSYSNISGNNITENFMCGIYMYGTSSNNTVTGNNVEKNGQGIELDDSSSITITGNNITENTAFGIYLYGSSNNTVAENNIAGNDGNAIGLVSSSSNNMLIGNNIANNGNGITLAYSSDNNSVAGNCITGNNGPGIWLTDSSNNILAGNTVTGSSYESIFLDGSDNTVAGNRIENNGKGIWVYRSSNTIIRNNITENTEYGIWLFQSPNSTVAGNRIENNGIGIKLLDSSSNIIYHNSFVNNANQIYDYSWDYPGYYPPSINSWDYGYPSGGSYWSDYVGVDLFSGPSQNETGSDGIGDTPYIVDSANQDNYPLMAYGTGLRHVGDVNDDGRVDIMDLAMVEAVFGSSIWQARYNPSCDFNFDGRVDIQDLAMTSGNFGWHRV